MKPTNKRFISIIVTFTNESDEATQWQSKITNDNNDNDKQYYEVEMKMTNEICSTLYKNHNKNLTLSVLAYFGKNCSCHNLVHIYRFYVVE